MSLRYHQSKKLLLGRYHVIPPILLCFLSTFFLYKRARIFNLLAGVFNIGANDRNFCHVFEVSSFTTVRETLLLVRSALIQGDLIIRRRLSGTDLKSNSDDYLTVIRIIDIKSDSADFPYTYIMPGVENSPSTFSKMTTAEYYVCGSRMMLQVDSPMHTASLGT